MPEDAGKVSDGQSKFSLGEMVITPNALASLSATDVVLALNRHHEGDWGDVDQEDWQSNERALKHGARLLSVYHAATGIKFWILTEWDRSVTTVLLPEDY